MKIKYHSHLITCLVHHNTHSYQVTSIHDKYFLQTHKHTHEQTPSKTLPASPAWLGAGNNKTESINTISWYKSTLTHRTAAMHSEASSNEVSRLHHAWVPLTEECYPEWNLPAARLLSGIWRDLQSTSQPWCLLYLPVSNTTTQINSRPFLKTLRSDTYHADITG